MLSQGLDPDFSARLDALIRAGQAQGVQLGLGSGYRTHARQQQLYDADVASHGGRPSGMVAPPGRSLHERGLAEDLTSGGSTVRAGTPADRFLAENAAQFGLTRPMGNEPWHVQPAGAMSFSFKGVPEQQQGVPEKPAGIEPIPILDRILAMGPPPPRKEEAPEQPLLERIAGAFTPASAFGRGGIDETLMGKPFVDRDTITGDRPMEIKPAPTDPDIEVDYQWLKPDLTPNVPDWREASLLDRIVKAVSPIGTAQAAEVPALPVEAKQAAEPAKSFLKRIISAPATAAEAEAQASQAMAPVVGGAAKAIGGDIADLGRGIASAAAIPGKVFRGELGEVGAPEQQEAAREFATTFGLGGGPKGALGSGFTKRVLGGAQEFARDVELKVAPMAAGSDQAMATATDFANKERSARFTRTRFDDALRKFSAKDQTAMWEAADAASVAEQAAGPGHGDRFLRVLPPEQEAAIRKMDDYGQNLWNRGRAAGIVDPSAQRLPYYTTRAIANIAGSGAATRVGGTGAGASPLDMLGVNLRTRGTQKRSFLTAEETEAAAKARFGQQAEIVRNIRSVPWAMERFEQAIAGRELVNEIEAIGNATGRQMVARGMQPPGFFTIDHPALKTHRPRFDATGKPLLDAAGNPIIDRVPIYVAREFEGPLRAVLSTGRPGMAYRGLMHAKAGAMSMIMNSPLIHNQVEFGRAFPAMPGKVMTFGVYRDGARFLRDEAAMKDAIEHGLVPIGHRGFIQDITGIAEEPELRPGQTLPSKAVGGAVGLVHRGAGEAVSRGMDKFSDFWHNKLLWDQVAKLQAGLYDNFLKRMIKDGIPTEQAKREAAHLANRFAGALPNEAMSEMAKKIANVTMFSRSFTMGNLGVMKDMVNGLPRNIRAQITRDLGTVTANPRLRGPMARRAIGIVMTDMALFAIGNAILESGIEFVKKSLDKGPGEAGSDIAKGYVRRAQGLMRRGRENWTDLLNPMEDLLALTPGSEHEPGKEYRVLLGNMKDGTAIYLRSPLGKIGEEFYGWMTGPIQQFKNKEGTIAKPLTNLLANDASGQGFGPEVYKRNYQGAGEAVENVARIAGAFLEAQFPVNQIRGFNEMLKEQDPERQRLGAAQAFAPMAGGFTISKGSPGGPAIGFTYKLREAQRESQKAVSSEVDDLIRAKKFKEAEHKMLDAGYPASLMKWKFKVIMEPRARITARELRQMEPWLQQHPREREQLYRQFEKHGIGPQGGAVEGVQPR